MRCDEWQGGRREQRRLLSPAGNRIEQGIFGLDMLRFLIAVGFGLMLTEAATAAPLVTAMFGAGFAASLPGALLSFGLSLAGSYLVNQVFGARDAAANDNRDPAQTSYGERQAFQGVIGRQVLGGHKVHYNEYDNAKFAQHVYVLADHLCDGLESVYIDGRQCNLIEVAGPYANNEQARYRVDGYGALLDIRFHDGRPGQLADTELVARTPGWDANYRFSGQCYVVVTLQSDREKFGGTSPDMKFVLRGAKLYDPRKDSSIGGVGAQRYNDPMTWAYSNNPGVAAYHFARGFRMNGLRRLGADLSPADLNFESAIAAMNVCDEQVQRPDGTWRNRYELHMTFDDEQAPYAVLDEMCLAMGGVRGEVQGLISFFAGKAKTPVLTITDEDLADGAPIRFTPKQSGVTLFSGVQGVYTHSTEFTPKAYEPINPAAFVAEDGRSRLQRVDVVPIQDAHQAYLVVKQMLYRSRLQATAEITLDLKDLKLECGDWIIWESEHSFRGTRTYEIQRVRLDWDEGLISLELREVSADAFADDATSEQVSEPARPRPFFGYQKNVFGFGVSAVALSGANGENLPALKFTYNPITDPAIRGLKVEYRILGDTQVFKTRDTSIDDGVFYEANGVMPGFTYEARAVLDAVPGREVIWTNWVPIDVPTGPMEVVAFESIDYSHLAKDLANEVGILGGTGKGSLSALIDHLKDEIERVAFVSISENVQSYTQRESLRSSVKNALAEVFTEKQVRASEDAALASLLSVVSAEVDDAVAAIASEEVARVSADDALAQSIINTAAAMGDAYAQGLFKVDATVTGGGAQATMTLKVRSGTGNSFADAGIRIIANSNGTSQIVHVANEMVILRPDGQTVALFGAGNKFDIAYIPNITADKISTSTLSALSANLGEVIAGVARSSNNKMRIELDNGRVLVSD